MKFKFVFDKRAIMKIERHGLTKNQVIEALKGKFYIQRSYGNKYFILCEYYGMIIKVIVGYMVRKKHWKAVTAYIASDKDRRLYKRKVKRQMQKKKITMEDVLKLKPGEGLVIEKPQIEVIIQKEARRVRPVPRRKKAQTPH